MRPSISGTADVIHCLLIYSLGSIKFLFSEKNIFSIEKT
ncbi:hypothetical protein BAZMOX_132670_0 [methanotrophic endosymbiont of Bathymodiolus azoricus (Menez Gwen)]|nr:hypothetical protein BAZMOX_132670_0 [methanotrophic endosymbiont of Bathymodiolus azoricus (Menez Gwen)]